MYGITFFLGDVVTMRYDNVFNANNGDTEVVVELIFAINPEIPGVLIQMEEDMKPKIGNQTIDIPDFTVTYNVSHFF